MTKTISTQLLVPVLAVAASLAFFAVAHAEDNGRGDMVGTEVKAGVQIQLTSQGEDGNGQSDNKGEGRMEGNSEGTGASAEASSTIDAKYNMDKKENRDVNDEDASSSTSTERESMRGMSEEHQSKVADIVHKLQELAGLDRGIGDDVREVAMEQASTSVEASLHMHTIESESPVKTFFFGSDFKSIGDLRSTVETTQNHIDRLQAAASKVTDPTVKAELEAEITALQNTASSTQTFIAQHEQAFSLFGWFLRIIGQ